MTKKIFIFFCFVFITATTIEAQTSPCDLVVTTTIDNACFGGTGSGTVLVETGSGSINYPLTATLYDNLGNTIYSSTILTGSGTGATGSGATFSIFNLSPEDYTLVIMDDTPCYDSSFVSVLEYDEIIITATIQDEINGNDGSIFVAVSGGTPPYSYSWSTGETTSDIQSVSGGTYVLTVIDANDCSGFISAVIQSYVGLEDYGENEIKAYPNPAKEFVTIEYSLAGTSKDVQLVIYNIKGQEVIRHFTEESHMDGRFVINVLRFTPGLYTYSLLFKQDGLIQKETGRIAITR